MAAVSPQIWILEGLLAMSKPQLQALAEQVGIKKVGACVRELL